MKRKDRSSTSTKEERKTKKTKKISDLEEIQQISKLDFTSAEKLFSSLIAPTTSDAFFTDYWEKKPLLIKREDSSFYGPLFTKEDLQDILKREELSFAEDVNVVRYVEGDKLYMNGDPEDRATWSQVSKDIKERNATVQFHQPQRFKDILWKLNAHLEKLFGCLVGANVYITPPDSQGLAPHHDDVEIFILQIEGKKQWKLYKPPTELAQEYSPDLDQDAIGQPTHEFELQPGDMVYFPRGTVHQAVTPKNDSHSTHITLSTYQQHAWGNLLSNVIHDAIDKAMENDVEFRRGLPINCYSYMGIGMQNDGKSKTKQEDFNNKLKQLLSSLAGHFDAHNSVDKVAADFMANRLPPIEQKEEAMKDDNGDAEKAPTEDSEVKFRYPEHVRVSVGSTPDVIPIELLDDDSDSEDSKGEDEEDSEDEAMDSSEKEEEKPKAKKTSKTKQKPTKKSEKSKTKKKQKEESDEESDDEDDDEKSKSKKKKDKKGKEKKAKKGKKEESEEDEEMESEDEKPKKKGKGKKDAETKTKKGKKGKKSESEDDSDDDSFELGEDDTEGDSSDDEDESDEEGEGPWVFVHHSLNNDPTNHMMETQQPSIIKFSLTFKDAVLHLYRERHDYIPVKSLPLESEDALHLMTSLWSEGLIDIKE